MDFKMKFNKWNTKPSLRQLHEKDNYRELVKGKLYLDLNHYRLYRLNYVNNKFLKPTPRGAKRYVTYKYKGDTIYLSKLLKDNNIEVEDQKLILFDYYLDYLHANGLIEFI